MSENEERMRPAERIARRLGWTEGQVYTIAIGLALAILTISVGLPPALRHRPPVSFVALPPGLAPPPPAAAPNEVPFVLPPPAPLPTVSFPPIVAPPSTPDLPAPAESPRPLTIVGAGWAGSDAGSALGTTFVPEGGLPVATRLGKDHRRSFILLDGTETVLRLGLVPQPTANMLDAIAVVQACPITTEGWSPVVAQSFEEAPKFDCTMAAVAERAADGSFVFDLATIPADARARGLALVPGPDAPPTFQVVFSASVLPPPSES